jgi:hypothetical protein
MWGIGSHAPIFWESQQAFQQRSIPKNDVHVCERLAEFTH